MIGSFITRGLVLIFGYAYPGYECYKTVEMNRPDIELLRFWCKYWILVAGLTVCERISDVFVGWIPMYGEAKLAFFIYLWFPKTKGTAYVYDSFFKPYVAKHEPDIDRNLLELRTRAGDMVVMYWQKSVSYSQTRILDILQYVASQSRPSQTTQTQPERATVEKTTVLTTQTSVVNTIQNEKSPSTSGSSSSSEEQDDDTSEEAGLTEDSKDSSPAPKASLKEQKTSTTISLVRKRSPTDTKEEQVIKVDSVSVSTSENGQPQDTVIEEARRVTRARSRKVVTTKKISK